MEKYAKDYCKREVISREQVLLDTYMLLKENYIAKLNNNGEYITIEFLNGQVFRLKVFEGKKEVLPTQI